MEGSHRWVSADSVSKVSVSVDGIARGEPSVPKPSSIASAEGVVDAIEGTTLLLQGPKRVTVRLNVPKEISLQGLLGKRVRVTLTECTGIDGKRATSMTITTTDGVVWLSAHHGRPDGARRSLGPLAISATLSQRQDGPLIVGTPHLMSTLAPGQHAVVRSNGDAYVVCFLRRSASARAAFIVARQALWQGDEN